MIAARIVLLAAGILSSGIGLAGAAHASAGTPAPCPADTPATYSPPGGTLSLYTASIPTAAPARTLGPTNTPRRGPQRRPLLAAPIWSPRQQPLRDLRHAAVTYARDSWTIYTAPARWNRNSLLWLAGLTATAGVLYAYDEDIHAELVRATDRDGYRWFHEYGETVEYVGHMGNMNRFYFGGLALGYLLRLRPLTTLSAQILEAHFISGAVKNLGGFAVGRERPKAGLGARHFDDGTSFPSGHAINITELAVIFAHHVRFLPFQIACYGTAAAVAFQRITSGAHWPSDVFAACVLGYLTAQQVLKLHEGRSIMITSASGPSGAVGLAIGCRW